jgi:hypothetical protein
MHRKREINRAFAEPWALVKFDLDARSEDCALFEMFYGVSFGKF